MRRYISKRSVWIYIALFGQSNCSKPNVVNILMNADSKANLKRDLLMALPSSYPSQRLSSS